MNNLNHLPEGCPETVGFSKTGLYCSFSIHKQNGPLNIHHPGCAPEHCHVLEVMPSGSRERLRALEAALAGLVNKLAPMMEAREFKPLSRDHACSECLAGYQPEFREMVIPGFQCAWHCARALTTGPLCLCGRALEEHTPEIGCTEFRHQEKK